MVGNSRVDPLPGLLRLAKVVQRDIHRLYNGVARRYLGRSAAMTQLFESVGQLSNTLKRSGRRRVTSPPESAAGTRPIGSAAAKSPR